MVHSDSYKSEKIEIGDIDKIEELRDQINLMTLQVFLTTQVNE